MVSITMRLTTASPPMQIRCAVAHALRYAMGVGDLTLQEARSLWMQLGFSKKDWASFHPMLWP